MSRKSQPLPTMPCSCGSLPVKMLTWAVQVTAGITSSSERIQPASGKPLQSRGEGEQPAGETRPH